MTGLLYKVNTNLLRACTIFPKSLEIYADYVVNRRRHWFTVEETTMTASNIAQVLLKKGLLFATIEVVNTSGTEMVQIEHVWNPHATKAKRILDQKLYQLHTATYNRRGEVAKPRDHHEQLDNLEKTLTRLKELLHRGKISQKEFDRKRRQLIKKVG